MGIELDSFRTAVKGDGQWLSVQNGDMSKVVGSAGKQEIDVSDLSVAQNAGDMNKAANNIYMRGQLLDGIRTNLASNGVNAAQTEAFVKKAEVALFGKLTNGQFNADAASQDLDSKTVKMLLDELDGYTMNAELKALAKKSTPVLKPVTNGINAEQRKEIATANLKAFVRFADEHQDAGDFYVRLSADGTGLESAGSRNIFRGSASKRENDQVRAFLRENVIAYYGSEANIPDSVKAEITGINGGGHPLSAKRIDRIWTAIELDRTDKLDLEQLFTDQGVARARMRSGSMFRCKNVQLSNELTKTRRTPLRNNWTKEKDPEVFQKAFKKDIGLWPFYDCAVLLHTINKQFKEKPASVSNQWTLDLTRTSRFVLGSQQCVYKYPEGKNQVDRDKAVQRQAENDIASFVTGGKVKDFNLLNDAQRKLAFFVKANLNQTKEGLSMKSPHRNPEVTDLEFTIDQQELGNANTTYSVDFTSDGGLSFKFLRTGKIKACAVQGDDVELMSAQSRCYEQVTVTYSKDDVANICTADFEQFSSAYESCADKNRNSKQDVKMNALYKELPKPFRVNPKVTLDFAMDIGE